MITIRNFEARDLLAMREIWNEVVRDGKAFPQLEELADELEADEFFSAQTTAAVACDGDEVVGLYILHPNNVGRCGHIANSSYAVKKGLRGRGIGEKLVKHSLETGREYGFRLLQFNAVVASNTVALELYKRLGFVQIGMVPEGFMNKDGVYEDICLFYHKL